VLTGLAPDDKVTATMSARTSRSNFRARSPYLHPAVRAVSALTGDLMNAHGSCLVAETGAHIGGQAGDVLIG